MEEGDLQLAKATNVHYKASYTVIIQKVNNSSCRFT